MTDLQDAAAAPLSLTDRVFVATTITERGAPRPLVAGTSIRLRFGDGTLGLNGGCNSFSFPMQIEPGTLRIDEGLSTMVGCEQARMDQDGWMAAFLENDPGWELCAPGLVLRGDDVVIELAEAPAPALWGTTFLSDRVTETGTVPAPVVDGTVIRMTFDEPDLLTVEAGCNTLSCRVRDTGDRLEIDDDGVASTDMACSPELQDQDEWLIALLTADPAYTLTSGGLTLRRGGTTVVLTPRPDMGTLEG